MALQVGGGEGEVSWEDVRRRRHEEEEDFPRQAAKIPRYRSKNTVWTVKNIQIIDIDLICQGSMYLVLDKEYRKR